MANQLARKWSEGPFLGPEPMIGLPAVSEHNALSGWLLKHTNVVQNQHELSGILAVLQQERRQTSGRCLYTIGMSCSSCEDSYITLSLLMSSFLQVEINAIGGVCDSCRMSRLPKKSQN